MTAVRLRIEPIPGSTPAGTYVERGGEIVWRPPFECSGVRLYVLVLEAHTDELRTLCDRWLNEPTRGQQRWRPASPHVLLTFVYMSRLVSDDPHDRALGGMTECECGVWVPIVDDRRDRFAWTVPYIWVNSDAALAGGREVFGFPKRIGRIGVPHDDKIPDALDVSALTLKRFDPDGIAKQHRVLRATPNTRAGEPLDRHWTELPHICRDLGRLVESEHGPVTVGHDSTRREVASVRAGDTVGELSGPAVACLLGEQLMAMHVPMVFLKQFRDATYPTKACYQAVVETVNRVTDFEGGGPLPVFTVKIEDLASVPFGRELGMSPGTHETRAGFWVDFSFVVDRGELLWEHRP